MFRIPSAIPPFPPFQPFQSRIRHAHEIALAKSFNLKKEFLKLSKNWGSYDCFCKITHVRRIINWFLLQFQLNPLTIIQEFGWKSSKSFRLIFSQNPWMIFSQNSWMIFSQNSWTLFRQNSWTIYSLNSWTISNKTLGWFSAKTLRWFLVKILEWFSAYVNLCI